MVVVPRERIPLALRGWGDAAMEQQWVIDSTRIRSDLGYEELVPRDEAMQHTIAWERANPLSDFQSTLFNYNIKDSILAGR